MKSNCLAVPRSFLLALVLLLPLASVRGVVINSTTTISAGDATYDGQDLVVSNCTLTVNGAHSFSSLQVMDNGVVKHSPAPTGEPTNALNLTIEGTRRLRRAAASMFQAWASARSRVRARVPLATTVVVARATAGKAAGAVAEPDMVRPTHRSTSAVAAAAELTVPAARVVASSGSMSAAR